MDIHTWNNNFIETHDRQVEARILRGLEAQRVEAQQQAELSQFAQPFERRLGRRLATNEHVVLAARVAMFDAAHVGDLALDPSADELAT